MRKIIKGLIVSLSFSMAFPVFAWTTVTVQKGQNVESIAKKYKPAGVSEMDMIIAVRSVNPGVEHKGLKTGGKLKVPTTSTEVRQAITGELGGAAKPAAKKAPAKAPPAKTIKPVAKLPVKVGSKSVAPPVIPAAITAQLASDKTTIASLQQTVNEQSQTIQNNQTQIANLNTQLSSATTTAATKPVELLSMADFWFLLWLLTLVFLWRGRKKNRASATAIKTSHVTSQALQAEVAKEQVMFVEPVLKKAEVTKDTERVEPKLHEINEDEWRQVELDIPANDAPAQAHMALSPSFTPEEERELTGERQDIIDAIANDHDNLEWHIALLEFYIKTLNDSAFKKHMDTMMRTGLMAEGDPLWEKVRKMYLNAWIYKKEDA